MAEPPTAAKLRSFRDLAVLLAAELTPGCAPAGAGRRRRGGAPRGKAGRRPCVSPGVSCVTSFGRLGLEKKESREIIQITDMPLGKIAEK